MASFFGVASAEAVQSQHAAQPSLYALLRLRTIVGIILCGAALLFTFGGAWDVVSHRTVGRDATFSPAHVTMLTALAIMGLTAMILVLVETRWARHNSSLRAYGITFAGGFSGPLGAYLTGFGVVAAATAFPLDNYWHSLYGIDVSLWAPFHVMIVMGAILSAIGATYLLLSTAHLAATQHARMLARLCTIAAMITLADVTSKLLNIVEPALSPQGVVLLPIGSINLYPLMMSVSVMLSFVAAIFAFSSRWAVAMVSLIRIVVNMSLSLAIPPVMAWQIKFAQEVPLTRTAQSAVQGGARRALLLSLLLFCFALVLDSVAWYARRKGWTLQVLLRVLFIAALPMLLVLATVGLTTFHEQRLLLASSAVQQGGLALLGPTTVLLSLALISVGALVGLWIGRTMGQSLKAEVR